jgi:2,4-diketo-3-deoxy-L-fuconate hydrolase
MRLFRFGPRGAERAGVVRHDGAHLDLRVFGEDLGEAFFGSDGRRRLAEFVASEGERLPEIPKGARVGACIARPSKIVCVGRNYRAHAAETGAEVPLEPLLFMKASSALSGPFDPVILPRGATKADWEVELAVVIGSVTRYVSREQALDRVFGYAVFNDYTERGFQRDRGGQWTKGKSADSFAPIGPYLVTADEVDPNDLSLRLSVNGVERQNASTRDMIFDVPTLIAHISEFMTLLPGDVISTGTPEGVGFGQVPPVFLKPGDRVEYSISGLGEARQTVVSEGA